MQDSSSKARAAPLGDLIKHSITGFPNGLCHLRILCIGSPREGDMRQLISFIAGRASQAITAVRRAVPPMRRGPVLWLVLCGGLLVVAIFLGTILMVGEFRDRAIANSERELQNTVTLLAHHFDEQFEDYQILTQNLIAQLDLSGVVSPEAFRQRMSGFAEHLKLKSEVTVLSYVDGVNIFDANGKLINSS